MYLELMSVLQCWLGNIVIRHFYLTQLYKNEFIKIISSLFHQSNQILDIIYFILLKGKSILLQIENSTIKAM